MTYEPSDRNHHFRRTRKEAKRIVAYARLRVVQGGDPERQHETESRYMRPLQEIAFSARRPSRAYRCVLIVAAQASCSRTACVMQTRRQNTVRSVRLPAELSTMTIFEIRPDRHGAIRVLNAAGEVEEVIPFHCRTRAA